LHERGLKLGIYTCVGTMTCKGKRPGSYNNYEKDAATLARWGVDLVKADYCNKPSNITALEAYTRFSKGLNATGRPMLFSLCNWGEANVQDWGGSVGQMYRIQMDHIPFWHWCCAAGAGFGQGTRDIINYVGTLNAAAFNKQYEIMDPDFLETLFWPTMNFIDSRTEYSFWALWSSPLVVATDLRNLTAEKRSILANAEVIAIDQDPLVYAGHHVRNFTNGGQLWVKELSNKDKAVILWNPTDDLTINVSVTWSDIGWPESARVQVRDLWKLTDVGTVVGVYSALLAPHDVAFLRLRIAAATDRAQETMVLR